MDKLKSRAQHEVRRLRRVNRRNLSTLRSQPLQELAGAFGDLGTFVPIFVALAQTRRPAGEHGGFDREGSVISVSSTLVLSGLANILTGIWFGIPLPVQPMKAIAAVVIAQSWQDAWINENNLASAGLFVAACVGALSITGLLHWFTRAIPVPVVKGIQMGAGLTLAMKAIPMFQKLTGVPFSDAADIAPALGIVLAITVLFLLSTFNKLPFALLVVAGSGALWALGTIGRPWNGFDGSNRHLRFSIWAPSTLLPTPREFFDGTLAAGLGQLPLTTLNSVVAVVYLAEDLFPDLYSDAALPGATSIGLSVALMNLIGCWFGAMPVCHGSGGLAAQYKFGARSGASVIILGLIKLVLGLFASELAMDFCIEFPKLILSILLLIAGQELVRMGENINGSGARDLWTEREAEQEVSSSQLNDRADEDGNAQYPVSGQQETETRTRQRKIMKRLTEEEKMRRWNVMGATIIGLLGAKNDGVGFVVGMLTHGCYNAHDWYVARRASSIEGRIRLSDDGDRTEGQPSTAS